MARERSPDATHRDPFARRPDGRTEEGPPHGGHGGRARVDRRAARVDQGLGPGVQPERIHDGGRARRRPKEIGQSAWVSSAAEASAGLANLLRTRKTGMPRRTISRPGTVNFALKMSRSTAIAAARRT